MAATSNRPHGAWFPLLFVATGGVAIVVGLVTPSLVAVLVGSLFAGVGGWVVVLGMRSHTDAVPQDTTVAALARHGWRDLTADVREHAEELLPPPVAAHLRAANHPVVARLAGIEPEQPQVAAIHDGLWDVPVTVAESWVVTTTDSTNDRITGGNIEPRVVAWMELPAPIGNVTIRPDNARMRLADLTGVSKDHTVDWEAVDTTWHLHGDDEALLRAVIDIGLMGRLADLPGRWIVRFVGTNLMVIPTAARNTLTAKPPTLSDVAGEIGRVVVDVRSILPQMLWSDLDGLLAGYRH